MGIPIFHCHLLLVLPSKLQDLQGNQCLVAIENAGKPMSDRRSQMARLKNVTKSEASCIDLFCLPPGCLFVLVAWPRGEEHEGT